MSVLNDGNNLPAVLVDIESELTQDYDPSLFGTTESVLILGTAFQGPSGRIQEIYNADMGRYFYGAPYDSETHRTATLTSGIQAAYNAGCRTIYAMRIGGQPIYKDFNLVEEDNKYRLRVQSKYPTNKVKECYVMINVGTGRESITLYKPASLATIYEKRNGAVYDMNTVLTRTLNLNIDYAITKDDSLQTLINTFNGDVNHNNVLTLSIVDKNGNDVTTAAETQHLCIGSLFSGIYFIGRDSNADKLPAYTTLKSRAIIADTDPKPYATYKGSFFYGIDCNTDITSDFPIYAESYRELQQSLRTAGVTSGSDYEFLETYGIASRLWIPDSKDYEDVELSNFEIYQKLGEGFVITAKAEAREGLDKKGRPRRPRVIETPREDANSIVKTDSGIYDLISNQDADYRVLVAVNADDVADGKLPKASEFIASVPEPIDLLGKNGDGALIQAMPRVKEDDLTAAKSYSFHFKKVDEDDVGVSDISDIYVDKIATIMAGFDLDPSAVGTEDTIENLVNTKIVGETLIPAGTKFMVFENNTRQIGRIIRVQGKDFSIINSTGLDGELIEVDGIIYQGQISTLPTGGQETTFAPLAEDTTPATGLTVSYQNKGYMLVDNGSKVFVMEIDQTAPSGIQVLPVGGLSDVISKEEVKTMIYAENCYGKTNKIVVTTGAADFVPLEEFVEILNEDPALSEIFDFTLTQLGNDQKDMYPEDIENDFAAAHNGDPDRYFEQEFEDPSNPGTIISIAGETYTLDADRTTDYDYNKYIPYRTSDNFVRQLAQHCARTSLINNMTHGVIGYTPIRSIGLSDIAARTNELLSKDYSLYVKNYAGRTILDNDGNPYDIGGNVSVTAFQHQITDSSTNYTSTLNGAAQYAGMITTLSSDRSTTNSEINLSSVDFEFSRSQLVDIINKGYVTVRNTSTKGLCVVDGKTMANPSTLRSSISVVRTLNVVGDYIRVAAEPFIGLKNSTENRNALNTAIDSALNVLVGQLINSYTFNIVNLSTYTADSKIDINYEIFPMNEIKSITNNITITRTATQG